jgi:mRNA-degrading endonuclease toxin of MazEF toxin-antitoxin module
MEKYKYNQIRTVDKLRLSKVVGSIPEEIIKKIEKALLIHVGISNVNL